MLRTWVALDSDTISIYHALSLSPTPSLSSWHADASQRRELLPGDHALIPAFVEHQEVRRARCAAKVESGSKVLIQAHTSVSPTKPHHRQVNTSDEPVRWIIIRSGSKPVTENIDTWGASKKGT